MDKLPPKKQLKELIDTLHAKIDRLQKENSQVRMEGHSEGYHGRVCLEEMCNFMANEDDDFHRSYNDVPLEELVFFVLDRIVHNDTTMEEFRRHLNKLIGGGKNNCL